VRFDAGADDEASCVAIMLAAVEGIPLYDYPLRRFCRKRDANLMQMEPAMTRSLAAMMAVLLIGISLMLSACGRSFEPGTRAFDTGTPVLEPSQPYGSVDLVGWR
jgi:hypothetical protein